MARTRTREEEQSIADVTVFQIDSHWTWRRATWIYKPVTVKFFDGPYFSRIQRSGSGSIDINLVIDPPSSMFIDVKLSAALFTCLFALARSTPLAQDSDNSQPITWINEGQAYCWQPQDGQLIANQPLVV